MLLARGVVKIHTGYRAQPDCLDVLVFDDCSVSRAAMAGALEGAGLSVLGIGTPLEATRAMLRNEARLLVVAADVRGIDCDRLVALLRGVDRLTELRVVMVSADRGPTTQRLAATAGADAVYVKSDDVGLLVDVVRELLDMAPASGTRRRPEGLDPQ